jgi:hypothetical protein
MARAEPSGTHGSSWGIELRSPWIYPWGSCHWVGFQRASVHLKGRAGEVPFNLRVTELFRREGGEWKLVHRHADELKSAPEK